MVMTADDNGDRSRATPDRSPGRTRKARSAPARGSAWAHDGEAGGGGWFMSSDDGKKWTFPRGRGSRSTASRRDGPRCAAATMPMVATPRRGPMLELGRTTTRRCKTR